MNWESLTYKQKSDLMRIYLQNGISSLDAMKEHYNSFQAGGLVKDTKDNPSVDAISGAARQAINTRKVIDDVNMFYTLDVVPRLVREHKGLSTIPNINFPKVERENIVEDVTPNREYDGYVKWFGSNIHINPIQYYKNEQRFGELLTHENAHVWQNKFPHLDSEYKNSKKEFLRQAYGNWNDKLRKSFSPLTPVGRNYRFNAELEADNRAVRYRIWDDLKNTIGRVPTLEELDNYINTIDDAVLYKKYIKPSGYLDIYSIPKEGDYFKENMQRVRQALIHVAQNNVQENTSHYAANGGSLGHITNLGQWQYPHQVTTIPSNNITMKGVDYPVIGVSNTGDTKYMLPNMDYLFNGLYVTEYPLNK